jgi:hypothetical protein
MTVTAQIALIDQQKSFHWKMIIGRLYDEDQFTYSSSQFNCLRID